jgi:hypothetical protein
MSDENFYYCEEIKNDYYKLQITIKNTPLHLRKRIYDRLFKLLNLFGSLEYQYQIENTNNNCKFCIVVKSEVIPSMDIINSLIDLEEIS